MKKIILICSLLVAQIALADGPRFEPGPVQKMDDGVVSIVNVLGANSAPFAELMQHGNLIREVTLQNRSPSVTVYTVTVQSCTTGGIMGFRCLGGARLTIIHRHEHGNMPIDTYKTQLDLLR